MAKRARKTPETDSEHPTPKTVQGVTPTAIDGIERDQGTLSEEILAAQAVVAPHAVTLEGEYLRACGKMYGSNFEDPTVADDPENWRHTWIRNFSSEVAQGTPECRIEPFGSEWSPDRAYLLEQAINTHARRSQMGKFASRCAIDFGFRSARAVCGLRSRNGRLEPFAERLPFDELLSDASMSDREKARWHGHRVSRDVRAVIAEAKERPELGWNLAMLEAVAAGLQNDPKNQKRTGSQVERYEIVYWPMWWPFEESGDPKKGYYGTVHYALDPAIAMRSKVRGGVIRKPEPWFGPESGPYAHAAAHRIGELLIELAPLVASASQGGHANAVARAMRDAIESYKQLGMVQDDVLQAELTRAHNGQTIKVPRGPDIRSMVSQIQLGGMQPQHVAAMQQAMESLQRSTGTHSRLGDVEAQATATAIQNAQMGYATTMGLYVNTYYDFLGQVFGKWAYWFDQHPKVQTTIGPLAPEYAEALGSAYFETQGNTDNPERHRDLALRIDPMSTKGRNDMTMQMDMMAALQLFQFVQAAGAHGVALDGKLLARQTARMRGAPWIENMADWDLMRQVAAMQIGQQEAPAKSPAQPKPQLGFGPSSGSSGSTPTPMGASMTQKQSPARPPAGGQRSSAPKPQPAKAATR